MISSLSFFFFFFNDTATTEIYTLSLHDALPISESGLRKLHFDLPLSVLHPELEHVEHIIGPQARTKADVLDALDRKSTRLNSSHGYISYAVFCLKKKKHTKIDLNEH